VEVAEDDTTHDGFIAFAQKFGKKYAHQEEFNRRYAIWKRNMQFITEHNTAGHSFTVKMNHFGDLEDVEFARIMTPKVKRPADNGAHYFHVPKLSTAHLPQNINWTAKGVVTAVKDQGACGSCWTFGTVGSLETVAAVKSGKLVGISEQQIVDCAWDYPNQGCNGGFAAAAYQWIIDNGGIATEESYPYLAQDGYCQAYNHQSGVVVASYVNVTQGSESDLQDAVATVGAVAVAIDATHPAFRFYASGVYVEPTCKNGIDDLDHEVLVTGYGVFSGQDYWLVKNSWSTHWGNVGYIMMARNHDNMCGIATQATYPIVA